MEPGAGGVERGQRRHVDEDRLRAALERNLVLVAAVEDQERHVALDVLRRGDVPARVLGGRPQLPGRHALARDDHQPGAAPGLRRLGVGRAARRVRVPAAPGLAAEVPGGHAPGHERRRPPARLAERLLVERARHGEPDVEPDEVHQLERPHPEAAGHAADAVDLLGRREAVVDDPQRLEPERAVAAVDDEAGAVGGLDHVLAHRLARLAGDAPSASGADASPATTSTSRILAGGLKKCMPTTRSGRGSRRRSR